MNKPYNNFSQLIKYFSNELTCALFLEEQRWGGKPLCPHCGSEYFIRRKSRLKHPELLNKYKDFRCKTCAKDYTVLTGTIFGGTMISLQIWFQAVYLIVAHKKGISSIQLANDLGITQKTAWFMLHRIREVLKEKYPNMIEGVVSIDETYVGGKNKNKHKNKRIKYGTCNKVPVIGLMEKNGKIIVNVIKNTKQEIVKPIINSNVKEGSVIVTDGYKSYMNLENKYKHYYINHKLEIYMTPEGYSTNNVENFWSILKRGIIGIYHYTSPKHLQNYCDEFQYRFNNRVLSDIEKFEFAIKQCNNTRLTYKDLIYKNNYL